MKTAIIYDRVNKWGGAERVLLSLHDLFPDAPLYTAVYSPEKTAWSKVFPQVIPTFLQSVPFLKDKHELLGTFTPLAFETLNISNYDLVISVTSEAAKGIITGPDTFHLCYCLTPTRYLWSGFDEYQKNPGILKTIPFYSSFSKPLLKYVKAWDITASARPDLFVGISTEVQNRIKNYYQRESELIYPPVEVETFSKYHGKKPDNLPAKYFLVVGRLVPYKKIDLVIEAFNELDLPLVIVGTGSEEHKLKKMAKGNIHFAGFVLEENLPAYYKYAEALIFPQEEDFGIVPLEAQASGIPVIAYKKGGVLDTVIAKKTGIFFKAQTKISLKNAVLKYKKHLFNKSELVNHANKFSSKIFKNNFKKLLRKYNIS
jgi:glycosyltransferase involved in cell wall biosynthesis